MKRLPRFLAVWAAGASLVFAGAACTSGQSDPTGTGTGNAGTTGTGQAGTSGQAGASGDAGTTGQGGNSRRGWPAGTAGSNGGGTAGTTGSAGTSRSAGNAGGAGTAGAGSAGTTGAGGRGGTTGSGGSTTGTGGTAPAVPFAFTSAPGAYWKPGTLTTVTSTADMMVTDTTTYQTWDGFGGAFNEMGWDDIQQLSAADQARAIKLLFDATDGARFVFGRIPIGASDYALTRYTLDEIGERLHDDELLDRRTIGRADPVREGGAGGEPEPAPVGQPVDAADVDEDDQRHRQRRLVRAHGQHAL